MIAKDGAEKTEAFLTGLKANLARTAGGGDRDVARDILADICDVGIANSYYVGLMRSGAGGPEQQEWGDAIKVILPTFADGAGTHVNISGAAVAKNAPNKDNAVKLLEFLVSPEAQAIYAKRELRISGARRRRDRSDHRRARRAEDRSAAAVRDRRAPQGGERARRQGRLRPGDVTARDDAPAGAS